MHYAPLTNVQSACRECLPVAAESAMICGPIPEALREGEFSIAM
jgi:hypothetical protein